MKTLRLHTPDQRLQNADAILVWLLLASSFLVIGESSQAGQIFATTRHEYVEQTQYDILTNWPTASLSAELDPAGNWGLATNGLQVSIRIVKDQYEPREPISAMILVRNVTNEELRYYAFIGYSPGGTNRLDSECCAVFASDAVGMTVPRKQPVPELVDGMYQHRLSPHEQWIYVVRLDRIFDLSQAGDYRFAAALGNLTETGFTPEPSKAKSGEVFIRMVAKDGPVANSTVVPARLSAEESGQKAQHLHTSARSPLLAVEPVGGGFSARSKIILGLIAALLAIIGAIIWRARSRTRN